MVSFNKGCNLNCRYFLLLCLLDCESSTAIRCLAYFLTVKSKKKAVESNADVPFLMKEVPVRHFNTFVRLIFTMIILIHSVAHLHKRLLTLVTIILILSSLLTLPVMYSLNILWLLSSSCLSSAKV